MPDVPTMSSDHLGLIVEDASSEVYVFAADDFKFRLVNRGGRTNLGYTMDELRELTPWDLKPLFNRDQFMSMVGPLLRKDLTSLEFETVHRRKDGTSYNVSVRLQRMRSDSDDVFYATTQDISSRKQAEAELLEASVRLDAILGNTIMAVFMMDERQHCVFMNKSAETLTGYKFHETAGRPLHDVIHHHYPDGRPFPLSECAIDRAFPENNQTQGEDVFVHKDGSFYPVGFTASPVKDRDGRTVGTVIEVRDISAQIEARNEREAFSETLRSKVAEALAERETLEAQLVQAQKMEAVGQLTGGVAHDFNNLLQVIGGNLELLVNEIPSDHPAVRRIHNALSGVERGAKLAAQLLAFGRQQALDPRSINVGALIRGMDDMLRRTLGETVEVETIMSAGLWNCLADPAQVENMLLNLAINARDAMGHRGKLTIEAGNASLDDAYAAGHAEVTAGQYVMLAVTDTGTGIPPDIIGRVFDPFYTTKGPGEGTGLGLSMVFGFVKQSGGHIRIYSEEGQGTTVRVYLPRTRRKADEALAEVLVTPPPGQGELVLVVEDDDNVRATTIDLLKDLGYAVLEARNADSAMAIVDSGLKIDLLFTDVVMPGTLRSPELARQAKLRMPHIAVLFTSGYTQNAIVHAGRLDDGVDLISKPYSRDGLARKIRDVLGRNQPKCGPEHRGGASGRTAPLRILVVEDETIIRMVATDMLSCMAHHVEDAASVEEAKSRLAAGKFDLLFTDIGLPDGSGFDLVRHVCEQYPEIGIIVASGHGRQTYPDDLQSVSRIVHLGKPYCEQKLADAVRSFQGTRT